jgi:hypothetical protein
MKTAVDIGARFGLASIFTFVHAVIPGVNLFESVLKTTSTEYINEVVDTINRVSQPKKRIINK